MGIQMNSSAEATCLSFYSPEECVSQKSCIYIYIYISLWDIPVAGLGRLTNINGRYIKTNSAFSILYGEDMDYSERLDIFLRGLHLVNDVIRVIELQGFLFFSRFTHRGKIIFHRKILILDNKKKVN